MTEKLTTIKLPNRRIWLPEGLVQLGEPSPSTRGTVQNVYFDGAKIGQVECITHTPFPKAAPGRAEKQWRMFPGTGRPTYDSRWQAVAVVLREHLSN